MRGHQFLVMMLGATLISPQLLRGEVIILGGAGAVKHGRAWGPEQALGPPDTPGAGDIQTAWASRTPDGQDEWLELDFEKEVLPTEVVERLKGRDAEAERRDREAAVLAELTKMRERLAAGEAENARLKAQQALLQAELKRAQALLKEYQGALEQLRKEKAKAPR